MTRVNLDMDERVLDVGDSYSSLHTHVQAWLDTNCPNAWQFFCDWGGYCIEFENPDHAVKFTLTWM